MKTCLPRTVVLIPLFNSGVAVAQSGNMMNGDMWSGGLMGSYGGAPVFLLIALIGVVIWFIRQKRKGAGRSKR